jgi:hypothetical protein
MATTRNDAERLAQQLLSGATPEQQREVLEALLSGRVSSLLDKLREPEPVVGVPPGIVRGFRIRLDLRGTKPPVWRRLELTGDLTLPGLHAAIQAAMGWTDSHLHRFRTGADPRAGYFVTSFDVEEGEDGVLEDAVRLDQLVATEGDRLWYEYDFGDGWDHVLTVESVLDEPPEQARCTAGRLACPPEDCGGIGGYDELATWARGGYDDTLLPDVFDDAAHAHNWLPPDWHPDRFDLEEVNAALSAALAEPVSVTGELAELLEQLEQRGIRVLREVLGRPLSHGPTEVSDEEAARVTRTYREFLDVIGEGVKLTSAGYLPPAVVESFAERSGITAWWIGKANREDLTPPVQDVRDTARALGLVTVRRGRLAMTAAGTHCHQAPQALWRHIVDRLPLGSKNFDRAAGWVALAVAGSGTAAEDWYAEIGDLLYLLGWRVDRAPNAPPPAYSPTLSVLNQLAGAAVAGWRVTGTDRGVAATARAVIQRS